VHEYLADDYDNMHAHVRKVGQDRFRKMLPLLPPMIGLDPATKSLTYFVWRPAQGGVWVSGRSIVVNWYVDGAV
jgi:hypothetical protein